MTKIKIRPIHVACVDRYKNCSATTQLYFKGLNTITSNLQNLFFIEEFMFKLKYHS